MVEKSSNNENQPLKILYQNIQKLVTKDKKYKIEFFKEYCKENNILLMNFTETWFNKNTQNDIEIKGYQLHRGDREKREGGGAAIYI